MTTIPQLPAAPTVTPTDQVLISHNGVTTTATVGQLLATAQPLVTIATNTLLGRASPLPGGPEALGIGHGLLLQSGTLTADTAALAPVSNAALTGTPTAPTAPFGDASAAIATTAFVAAATASAVLPTAGAGLRRAGVTLSVNLAGIDAGASTVQSAPGVTRPISAIATDQPSARNLGAKGDGVADDTAAILALNAAGGGNVPPGIYNTTLDAGTFTNGRVAGAGRVRDGSKYLRAPSITAIASKPAGSPDESWIGPAFNGDFSRTHLAFEHRVTDTAGGHTLGLPGPNSYLYNPQTAAIYGYVYNSSGYNGAVGNNSSRTGMVASRIKIDQYGQGDMVAYNASGFVASTLPSATHFLANPAVTLFNGDLQAGADGTYLNPIEVIINDQGHDVAGAGSVVNLNRTNNAGALGVSWFGYRTQSVGTKPIDAHFSTSGGVRVSMDLVGATSPIKGAIAMKANDRLYFNATNPDSHLLPNTLLPGTEWLEYDAANGAQFVVGGTPVAQFKPTGGKLAASPSPADNSTAIATTAFVKSQAYVSKSSTHLFAAVDYGAKFDGASDDAPGIQAAINAARDAGGGRVVLPGRKGTLQSGLVIDHPAIAIAGTGASTLDDYTAQTYLAGRAGTRLVWNGPLGGTMLTLQLSAAINGSAVQLKGCDIAGILWDCNAASDTHGIATRGAATAVATWFGWDSHHDIYFMNPTQIGVRYETCQGITARIYGACFAVVTASALQLAGSTRTGTSAYGNTSLNNFPVVRVGIVNGDGVVFRETDHNYMATVDVIRAAGGTGRGVVFAGARDQPPGGPVNAFCAYMNRILYCNTNGAPIVAEGTDTAGVIAASFGNIIEWLDTSNTTPLPTKGAGASIFYADDSGYTYNPLVVSPVFSNQSGQLTSGGIQAQLAGETVAIWHSATAHMRLYSTDYYTIWRFGVNTATGNLELAPDRNLHGGAVQVSIGGGAGLHVDGAVVTYGSGQFNNLTVASPSNAHSVGIATNIGSGYLNPLAQAGDNFLSFSAGSQDTGGLVIGPWASHGYGLRLAADGTASVNGSPIWTAATLANVGQLANNAGYLTLASQPIATTSTTGTVKVGAGLMVAVNGTLATVPQPIANATVAGVVKVGGGISVAADGTLTAVVATLAAMRALPWAVLADGATLSVAAYATRGDGGGGVFTWNATASAVDDGGTVLTPTGNAGAGRWLRQIVLGRVTPQMFGAKGDGVTNDTAAFNAALKIGRVTVPFASYVVSGLLLTNGCEMEGGAGLGYSGDTATTAVVRPILIAAPAATNILNVSGIKDFSLSGLFLDGNNTGCDGISAGSTQMTLNRMTVVRCTNGLGSATGADLYTHIATLIDCQFANCTNGVVNLIDSAMLAGAVSACQYGLWLSSGAAANNFIGVRYEWCTQHNIHIFQAQKNQFIGGLVDRGYVAGAYLAGAADIHFVGVQFSRNGRNNDATWLGNSHVVLDSNNASIAVTNPIWTTGKDDDGTGALTPQYGVTYNNANDRVTITSGDGGGFVTGFARGSEPSNYVLRDVSGAGDSIVTAARPYLRGGTAAHTTQTRTSANITTGLSSTIAMGQSAITGGYTAYSRELKLYALDFSTGTSYAARFNLTFYYDTTAHLPSVSAAYGEIGGAGIFQFSTTTGTLRLSVTGLSVDGSAFTLNVKNAGATGNYGVWAELL